MYVQGGECRLFANSYWSKGQKSATPAGRGRTGGGGGGGAGHGYDVHMREG